MTVSQHTRGRFPGLWRTVRRAFATLGYTRAEQIQIQEACWQANRAAAPETGVLTWVLTLDGYRLAGSHLPARGVTGAGGTPGPAHRPRPRRRHYALADVTTKDGKHFRGGKSLISPSVSHPRKHQPAPPQPQGLPLLASACRQPQLVAMLAAKGWAAATIGPCGHARKP